VRPLELVDHNFPAFASLLLGGAVAALLELHLLW
jgi:hypothetical protein